MDFELAVVCCVELKGGLNRRSIRSTHDVVKFRRSLRSSKEVAKVRDE